MTDITHKFEQGRTYYTTANGDHNMIISVKVIKRTPKTILALVNGREEKRLRIQVWKWDPNIEKVYPWGSGYSMAPIIGADHTERPKTDWDR